MVEDKLTVEPEPTRNLFRRKRRANQTARYLNKREAAEWRGKYNRAGNRKVWD